MGQNRSNPNHPTYEPFLDFNVFGKVFLTTTLLELAFEQVEV